MNIGTNIEFIFHLTLKNPYKENWFLYFWFFFWLSLIFSQQQEKNIQLFETFDFKLKGKQLIFNFRL